MGETAAGQRSDSANLEFFFVWIQVRRAVSAPRSISTSFVVVANGACSPVQSVAVRLVSSFTFHGLSLSLRRIPSNYEEENFAPASCCHTPFPETTSPEKKKRNPVPRGIPLKSDAESSQSHPECRTSCSRVVPISKWRASHSVDVIEFLSSL